MQRSRHAPVPRWWTSAADAGACRTEGALAVKNTVVSVFMSAVVAGVVGVAGYYLWEFYSDEQAKQTKQREPQEAAVAAQSADAT